MMEQASDLYMVCELCVHALIELQDTDKINCWTCSIYNLDPIYGCTDALNHFW